VVNAFYDGAPDENGEPLFGRLARGSELGLGGCSFQYKGPYESHVRIWNNTPTQVLKYLLPASRRIRSVLVWLIRPSRTPKTGVKIGIMAADINADDPDFYSAFQAAGVS